MERKHAQHMYRGPHRLFPPTAPHESRGIVLRIMRASDGGMVQRRLWVLLVGGRGGVGLPWLADTVCVRKTLARLLREGLLSVKW